MSKNLWVTAGLLTSVLAQGWAQTESRQLSIDTKTLGIEISPTLSGIFFEDINQSLDGGVCAQMIQNNSFQAYNVPDGPANEFSQSDTIFFGWTVVSREGAVGQARAVSDHPLVTLARKYDTTRTTTTTTSCATPSIACASTSRRLATATASRPTAPASPPALVSVAPSTATTPSALRWLSRLA